MTDWATTEKGTAVKVRLQKGTYKFISVNPKDGSLLLWGGISGREHYRSFKSSMVSIPRIPKRRRSRSS